MVIHAYSGKQMNHFSCNAKKYISKYVFDNTYVKYAHGVKILHREAFGARISPKLNRTSDYVAKYVCTLGVNQDSQILDILSKFHDNYLL